MTIDPSLRTFALETLGCKVNQYESGYFQEALLGAGLQEVPFREKADLYVVHSCAVTAKAAYQTRQLLRRAKKLNPEAFIVVAGCNAQLEPSRFAEEGLATHVLGTREKLNLLHWLQRQGRFHDPVVAVSDSRLYNPLAPLPVHRMLAGRARAFVKVQDGCDAFCSYCIVPYTRGKSRSLPAEDVKAQLAPLVEAGYREVVLTGIHLGQWGKDLEPSRSLTDLLEAVVPSNASFRLRLSSLEPMEWSRELLRWLEDRRECVCPHFHVPLQSGDARILARMRRPYTPDRYARLILELRARFPHAALGADVLAGFPGETEARFLNTLEWVRDLPLTYLHVFPFSPRPPTPAAAMKDRPDGVEVKRRTALLRELGRIKGRAFRESQVGRRVDVLVEGPRGPGWWKGVSENYLKVTFAAPGPLDAGSLVKVRLDGHAEDGLRGTAVAEPEGRPAANTLFER